MGRDQARKDLQSTVKQFSAYKPDSKVCCFAYLFYNGLLLLAKRTDTDEWACCGGHAISGESPEEALQREVKEESGIDLSEIDGSILGNFSIKKPNGDDINIYLIDLKELPRTANTDEMKDFAWFNLNHLPENTSQATLDTIMDDNFIGTID